MTSVPVRTAVRVTLQEDTAYIITIGADGLEMFPVGRDGGAGSDGDLPMANRTSDLSRVDWVVEVRGVRPDLGVRVVSAAPTGSEGALPRASERAQWVTWAE